MLDSSSHASSSVDLALALARKEEKRKAITPSDLGDFGEGMKKRREVTSSPGSGQPRSRSARAQRSRSDSRKHANKKAGHMAGQAFLAASISHLK